MRINNQKQLYDFLLQSEKLKTVLRHSWLSNGRRESTAEHTWRMALMAWLFASYLHKKVNLTRVLKMVLVHDLVEVYAPDWPAFKKVPTNKTVMERKSLRRLVNKLPRAQQQEIINLWEEFEAKNTAEARFAQALDKLEVMVQHNQSSIKHQNKTEMKFNLYHGIKQCEYDSFLKKFRQLVKTETLKYYRNNKVNKRLYA